MYKLDLFPSDFVTLLTALDVTIKRTDSDEVRERARVLRAKLEAERPTY